MGRTDITHDLDFFRYRKDGKIGRLTHNRPDVLNAFHYPAVREFERLVELVADDPDTRLVAIVGEGRAFSTGMDLKELPKGEVDIGYHEKWERTLRLFETMDKIVLCLLHGYAIGGGLQGALKLSLPQLVRQALRLRILGSVSELLGALKAFRGISALANLGPPSTSHAIY